jgi:hypothetical protein
VKVSHYRFYHYSSESDDNDISICSSDRKRIEEENNFKAQIKPNNNFHPPRPNNYERRPFSPHNQVSQIENDNTSIAESDFPQ